MALVFGDSCDHYLAADILKKWTNLPSVAAVAIDPLFALPPHAFGMQVSLVGNGSSAAAYLEKTLPATQEIFISGVWFYTPSFAQASSIMTFVDGSTEHVSVRHDTSGHITFTRNGTVLATSTNTLSINTWYHIETKVTIGDAADSPSGRYEVRVSGSATGWIPDSGIGQDTRNAGNKSISAVHLHGRGSGGGQAQRYQDFYILDTTGSVAIDFLGPCRFAVIRPVGTGSSAQWTGNYAENFVNVADVAGDGDSTFNQDSTAGHIDLFTMTKVPAGTVHAIQHVLMARQDAGAARTIRPKTRISGTNYNGTTVSTGGSYVYITEPRSVSPASGVAWTAAEINAAEFGYELVS